MNEVSLYNYTINNDIILDNENISNNENKEQITNKRLTNTKKRINKIVFNSYYHGVSNFIVVEKNKLDIWRKKSEFIDVLMSSYNDDETLQLYLNDIVDLYSLIIIFNFFDTNKISSDIESEYKTKILNGLAYFGINSEILNSIKKGFGLVWKLYDIDNEINEKEKELKNKINEIDKHIFYENFNTEDISKLYKLNEYKKLDEDILLNKNTYNLLYEKLHENFSINKKQYEHINNTINNICPEFDLNFIKSEFEKLSNNIFNDLDDCVVTGEMLIKHFTYNSYFIDSSYNVYLFTKYETRALEIIKILYDRLNSKIKTYIIKTKNTITLYNKNFELKIITKLYNSITDIFTNFDLDCCCVGYSKGNLYALPRFIRSLAYSGNIFDPEKQSSNYIHRLKKYIKKNFSLFIPGMKKNDIDYNKNNYIIRKLREKTDVFEKDSDFFVLIKNRDNKELHEILDHFHNKNKYLDVFEIQNINYLHNYLSNINWIVEKNIEKIDMYYDMYSSDYIK